jgi:hypothetical protein
VDRALPLAALLLLAVAPATAQDAAKKGPPAFVPLESPAVTSQLRAAAALVSAGKAAEAVEAYQAVVDGPLGNRLAVCDTNRDTLEQARERAHREMSSSPALVLACGKRFEETAAHLLASALADSDGHSLREVFLRFPLTDSGARAGLMLARNAWRAGDAEDCLGLLDRLLDLRGAGLPAAAPAADVLALRAAAAAAAGDGDLLAATERAAAALGGDATVSGGGRLRDHIAGARASLAPPGPPGPRGPLVLLWQWMPEEAPEDSPEPGSQGPLVQSERPPPPPDHLLAVAGGRVYWTDPWGVTAIDLATGGFVTKSAPVSPGRLPPPGRSHEGETFAPAADGAGVVAALDLPPETSATNRRLGTLDLFDADLRLLARRGGEADIEHPEMSRRFVFHGRPLLVGDRVYCAATEAVPPGEQAAGDVRTHVIAFHRAGLEPAWDTFVAYGSGIHLSDVAPAGSIAQRHGRLYLATQTGLEACLEARTGAVLWAHRYRTPEMAPTPRLMPGPDGTMTPFLWYESPPVFSGDLVAFAPRDSYSIDFVYQRPVRGTGEIREMEHERPRRDLEDMHALWVLAGPGGRFFLAGMTARLEAAPLVLRDLRTRDEDGKPVNDPIPWRGALMERTVTGLPVRAADGLYAATEKAVYFLPFPGPDGAVERIAVVPPPDADNPRPSTGNLLVLRDRILSVHNDGILCFGPAPRKPEPPK